MPLTDTAIRTAKPAAKPVRLFDGGGLYLEVSPSGGKLWRMKYRHDGKEKRLSFGAYPAVSLKDARERRDEAKKLLANGVDPGEVKKAQKAASQERAANSFEAVAREWFGVWSASVSATTAGHAKACLERDVFPWLGSEPVAGVSASMVLAVLRRMEKRGLSEAVRKVKTSISQIMRYAIATGRAERDPCPDLRGALAPIRQSHMAAITTPAEAGGILRAMDAFKGTFTVRAALLLAPLLFVRPGELRAMKWADIDIEKGEWRYLVTKTETDHLVPLARQAVAILEELRPLTGRHEHVFPGVRDPRRAMSDATINAALRRLGYDTKTEMTGHGFRAMARTLLAEELHFPPEVIEHQLAHKVPDALGTAYNRTKFLKERRAMMQAWADYLDRLKAGAKVISLRA